MFPSLQSAHFVSQLEQFAASHSLGVNALKNVVKSYLIISSNCCASETMSGVDACECYHMS